MFRWKKPTLTLIRKNGLAAATLWGKKDKDGSLAGLVVDGMLDFKNPRLGHELRAAVLRDEQLTPVDEEGEVVIVPFYDVETRGWRNLFLFAAHVPPVERA